MSEPTAGKVSPDSTRDHVSRADAIQRLLDRPITPADLESGTAMAARPAESRSSRSTRLLLFRIGEETAALPARMLRRVTPVARASPIPHRSTGVLRGVCNIRGELILCADLGRLLGLPDRESTQGDSSSDSRRMVVLGPPDNSWAFEADAVMGVETFDPSLFREPPVTVEYSIGAFTLGVAEAYGRSITILDGERVLAGFKAGLA